MPAGERSEEVWLWYTSVYEAVQEIPRSRVTSYGHIARLVGKPERPRQVGVCLKNLPQASQEGSKKSGQFDSSNVPWQRVINSRGGISPRGPDAAAHQAAVLEEEGVEVTRDAMGQYSVDLARYGWFPDALPSEAEDKDEDEDEAAYRS